MTIEQLLKLNKASLSQICTDLGIEVLGEDTKKSLAEKISTHADWPSHASYETSNDEPTPSGEEQGEEGEQGELTEDEKKHIYLQEQCIDREIAMTGEETIEELEALIKAQDDENIKAAERFDAVDRATKLGIDTTDEDTTEEILSKIETRKAELSEAEQAAQSAEAQLKERIAKGVTFEDLQKGAETMVLMCEQMIKQLNAQKKSPDRFHKAVKDLSAMKRDIFIR